MDFDRFRKTQPKKPDIGTVDSDYAKQLCELQSSRKTNIFPILGSVAAVLVLSISVTVWLAVGGAIRDNAPIDDSAVSLPATPDVEQTPEPDVSDEPDAPASKTAHYDEIPLFSATVLNDSKRAVELDSATENSFIENVIKKYQIPLVPLYQPMGFPNVADTAYYFSMLGKSVQTVEQFNTDVYEMFAIRDFATELPDIPEVYREIDYAAIDIISVSRYLTADGQYMVSDADGRNSIVLVYECEGYEYTLSYIVKDEIEPAVIFGHTRREAQETEPAQNEQPTPDTGDEVVVPGHTSSCGPIVVCDKATYVKKGTDIFVGKIMSAEPLRDGFVHSVENTCPTVMLCTVKVTRVIRSTVVTKGSIIRMIYYVGLNADELLYESMYVGSSYLIDGSVAAYGDKPVIVNHGYLSAKLAADGRFQKKLTPMSMSVLDTSETLDDFLQNQIVVEALASLEPTLPDEFYEIVELPEGMSVDSDREKAKNYIIDVLKQAIKADSTVTIKPYSYVSESPVRENTSLEIRITPENIHLFESDVFVGKVISKQTISSETQFSSVIHTKPVPMELCTVEVSKVYRSTVVTEKTTIKVVRMYSADGDNRAYDIGSTYIIGGIVQPYGKTSVIVDGGSITARVADNGGLEAMSPSAARVIDGMSDIDAFERDFVAKMSDETTSLPGVYGELTDLDGAEEITELLKKVILADSKVTHGEFDNMYEIGDI